MSLLNFGKKKKDAENIRDNESGIRLNDSSNQTAAASSPQQQRPGDRMTAVMERMYRMVFSVDLDRNSCYLECGDPNFGEVKIPRKAAYDALFNMVRELPMDSETGKKLSFCFSKNALIQFFTGGRNAVSELLCINEEFYEIRAERMPEISEDTGRIRCCIYVRKAAGASDDGWTDQRKAALTGTPLVSEEERVLNSIFVGAYEFNIEKNILAGFEWKQGKLVKSGSRIQLKEKIEDSIKSGAIDAQSAAVYKKFLEKDYLKKRVLGGSYSVEVLLKRPGQLKYRWYEDIVTIAGSNFRVYRRDIDIQKRMLEQSIQEEEQEKFYNYNSSMLKTVAGLVEFRNLEMGAHITHVNELTRILLEDIGDRSPQYQLTKAKVRLITEASTIHDIGKITIPDALLNKPEALTEDEFEIMKTHAINGETVIDKMDTGDNANLYECCKDIAKHHHERYDGKGYPEGLKGDNISIGAQAVGLADAFDALCSNRSYKRAFPADTAYQMILNGECGQFNPRLIESLKKCYPKIKAIYSREKEYLNGEE